MKQSRRQVRAAAVIRFALWLALMVAAVGTGLVAGAGAGLVAAGLLSAAVLYFVVDIDSPAGGRPR